MQPRVQRATRKFIDFALVEDYPLRFSNAKGAGGMPFWRGVDYRL